MNLFDVIFAQKMSGGGGGGTGIPVASDSLKPIEFGCDNGGFYFSDTAGTGNSFGFGRDSTGIYAEATT